MTIKAQSKENDMAEQVEGKGGTPRTDALIAQSNHDGGDDGYHYKTTAIFARTLERENAQLRKELESLFERLETGTLHRIICNADHSKPTGGDMCVCNPLKEKLAAAEAELHALNSTLEQISKLPADTLIFTANAMALGALYRRPLPALESYRRGDRVETMRMIADRIEYAMQLHTGQDVATFVRQLADQLEAKEG